MSKKKKRGFDYWDETPIDPDVESVLRGAPRLRRVTRYLWWMATDPRRHPKARKLSYYAFLDQVDGLGATDEQVRELIAILQRKMQPVAAGGFPVPDDLSWTNLEEVDEDEEDEEDGEEFAAS